MVIGGRPMKALNSRLAALESRARAAAPQGPVTVADLIKAVAMAQEGKPWGAGDSVAPGDRRGKRPITELVALLGIIS